MTISKDVQAMIARYKKFDSQTFQLLRKANDLETPEDALEECWGAWLREASYACSEIRHLWSRILREERLEPLEYDIEANMMKSLRSVVIAMRHRLFVTRKLRRLKSMSRRKIG